MAAARRRPSGPNAVSNGGTVDFGNVVVGYQYLYKYAAQVNVQTNDTAGFVVYSEGATDLNGSNPVPSPATFPIFSTLFWLPTSSGNTPFSPATSFNKTGGTPINGGQNGITYIGAPPCVGVGVVEPDGRQRFAGLRLPAPPAGLDSRQPVQRLHRLHGDRKLRTRKLLGLFAFVALAALAVCSQADALTSLKTYKVVVINIVVTPSPAPVGLFAPAKAAAPAPAPVAVANVGPAVQQPPSALPPPFQIASSGSAWDVAPGAPFELAQSTVQPTPVPVQFVAKADPNAAYLQITPNTPPAGYFAAPYGTTTFPCAFTIFTYYTNSYYLQDWGYGTNKTSGSASGTFPMENYPTVSDLAWSVPDLSTPVTPYWNQGPGGEKTWSGVVKQSQTHCINLQLTVPNTQPAGSFTAAIQYNLYVTLP